MQFSSNGQNSRLGETKGSPELMEYWNKFQRAGVGGMGSLLYHQFIWQIFLFIEAIFYHNKMQLKIIARICLFWKRWALKQNIDVF